MSAVIDPQFSIDDIALNYQVDGNFIVTPLPSFVVGNDAFCLAPGVCIAANVYRANANIANQSIVKAYLNNKAQAALIADSFDQSLAHMALTTYPPSTPAAPKQGVLLTIPVSGMRGHITKVTITLYGMTSVNPSGSEDANFVLVSPAGGQAVQPMYGAGCSLFSVCYDMTNVTFIFDDAAPAPLVLSPFATGPLVSGTYKCSSFNPMFGTVGPPPTGPQPPPAPYSTSLSTFNGQNPNGTWMLFGAAMTVVPGAAFTIQGWGLHIKTA